MDLANLSFVVYKVQLIFALFVLAFLLAYSKLGGRTVLGASSV